MKEQIQSNEQLSEQDKHFFRERAQSSIQNRDPREMSLEDAVLNGDLSAEEAAAIRERNIKNKEKIH